MKDQYSIVITTTNSKEAFEKIAKALLDQKLAACIQITQIKSFYTWKDNVTVDDEQLLLIKIKSNDYQEVENCIKQNHSYEIPEIVEIPITNGSPEYLNWINKVTND